jgi:hypothetical protein
MNPIAYFLCHITSILLINLTVKVRLKIQSGLGKQFLRASPHRSLSPQESVVQFLEKLKQEVTLNLRVVAWIVKWELMRVRGHVI